MTDTELIKIAKALSDPTRLAILRTVMGGHELCCGDLGRCSRVSQATVSHHLRILQDAGLVASRRSGQFIRIRPVPETLERYRQALNDSLPPSLADLGRLPEPTAAGS